MSIKRDTLYNLCGSIAPMLISLLTVPAFLHLIGNARYGVLALVWLFLGYFGMFDPGITRAAAFHISRLHGAGQAKERESVFWTALLINSALGMLGGVIFYFAARPFFMSTFKMPESMRAEVIASLPWLAVSIPVSITGGVLTGALQAREWFGLSNIVRVANTTISQLAPLAVAYWHGPDLTWLIPTVLIARALGAIPTSVALIRALPLGIGGSFDFSRLKDLFSYGGWVTITNLLDPLLNTMDRMMIGSLLNADAVAFYTVPFNLVSRASILPGALSISLFPKLSRSSTEARTRLASEAVTALAALMTPITVLGMAALPIFMQHWVGRSFAEHAAPVGIIVLAGVWINGLAFIPYEHIQASGRPDLITKFHAIEVIPFLGLLWVSLHYFGLIGAAYSWTFQVAFDAALLFLVAGNIQRWQRLVPGGIIVLIAGFVSPRSIFSVKTVFELILLLAAIIWSWNLSSTVRFLVRGWISTVRVRTAV